MPFVRVNLKDIPEQRPVPVGIYDLVITECEVGTTKELQKPQFIISIAIEGHDDAPNVRHYAGIPSEMDDAKQAQFKGLMLRRFCELFDIEVSDEGFDTDQLALEMVGQRARAELRISDDGNFNNLFVPKIKDDRAPAGGTRGVPRPPKR